MSPDFSYKIFYAHCYKLRDRQVIRLDSRPTNMLHVRLPHWLLVTVICILYIPLSLCAIDDTVIHGNLIDSYSSSDTSRSHHRRALGDPLVDRIRELQLMMTESTNNKIEDLNDINDPVVNHLRHRHRHYRKREQDDGGLKVKANLHSTSNWGQSDQPHRRRNHRQRQQNPSYNFMTMGEESKSCPRLHGKDRIQCPSSSGNEYHVCIFKSKLCDDVRDCPNGEDEDKTNCLFYRTTLGHFKQVVDAVVDLTDHLLRSHKRHHEL